LIKVHLLDALGRLVFSMLRLLSAVRFASKLVKPKHHCYASCHVALCISFTTKIPVDQSCLFWLPCERGLPVSIGPAGRPFSISARGALFQFPIEAALAAPRPAKKEATRGAVLISGPICRHMFTYLKQTPDQYAAICF